MIDVEKVVEDEEPRRQAQGEGPGDRLERVLRRVVVEVEAQRGAIEHVGFPVHVSASLHYPVEKV